MEENEFIEEKELEELISRETLDLSLNKSRRELARIKKRNSNFEDIELSDLDYEHNYSEDEQVDFILDAFSGFGDSVSGIFKSIHNGTTGRVVKKWKIEEGTLPKPVFKIPYTDPIEKLTCSFCFWDDSSDVFLEYNKKLNRPSIRRRAIPQEKNELLRLGYQYDNKEFGMHSIRDLEKDWVKLGSNKNNVKESRKGKETAEDEDQDEQTPKYKSHRSPGLFRHYVHDAQDRVLWVKLRYRLWLTAVQTDMPTLQPQPGFWKRLGATAEQIGKRINPINWIRSKKNAEPIEANTVRGVDTSLHCPFKELPKKREEALKVKGFAHDEKGTAPIHITCEETLIALLNQFSEINLQGQNNRTQAQERIRILQYIGECFAILNVELSLIKFDIEDQSQKGRYDIVAQRIERLRRIMKLFRPDGPLYAALDAKDDRTLWDKLTRKKSSLEQWEHKRFLKQYLSNLLNETVVPIELYAEDNPSFIKGTLDEMFKSIDKYVFKQSREANSYQNRDKTEEKNELYQNEITKTLEALRGLAMDELDMGTHDERLSHYKLSSKLYALPIYIVTWFTSFLYGTPWKKGIPWHPTGMSCLRNLFYKKSKGTGVTGDQECLSVAKAIVDDRLARGETSYFGWRDESVQNFYKRTERHLNIVQRAELRALQNAIYDSVYNENFLSVLDAYRKLAKLPIVYSYKNRVELCHQLALRMVKLQNYISTHRALYMAQRRSRGLTVLRTRRLNYLMELSFELNGKDQKQFRTRWGLDTTGMRKLRRLIGRPERLIEQITHHNPKVVDDHIDHIFVMVHNVLDDRSFEKDIWGHPDKGRLRTKTDHRPDAVDGLYFKYQKQADQIIEDELNLKKHVVFDAIKGRPDASEIFECININQILKALCQFASEMPGPYNWYEVRACFDEFEEKIMTLSQQAAKQKGGLEVAVPHLTYALKVLALLRMAYEIHHPDARYGSYLFSLTRLSVFKAEGIHALKNLLGTPPELAKRIEKVANLKSGKSLNTQDPSNAVNRWFDQAHRTVRGRLDRQRSRNPDTRYIYETYSKRFHEIEPLPGVVRRSKSDSRVKSETRKKTTESVIPKLSEQDRDNLISQLQKLITPELDSDDSYEEEDMGIADDEGESEGEKEREEEQELKPKKRNKKISLEYLPPEGFLNIVSVFQYIKGERTQENTLFQFAYPTPDEANQPELLEECEKFIKVLIIEFEKLSRDELLGRKAGDLLSLLEVTVLYRAAILTPQASSSSIRLGESQTRQAFLDYLETLQQAKALNAPILPFEVSIGSSKEAWRRGVETQALIHDPATMVHQLEVNLFLSVAEQAGQRKDEHHLNQMKQTLQALFRLPLYLEDASSIHERVQTLYSQLLTYIQQESQDSEYCIDTTLLDCAYYLLYYGASLAIAENNLVHQKTYGLGGNKKVTGCQDWLNGPGQVQDIRASLVQLLEGRENYEGNRVSGLKHFAATSANALLQNYSHQIDTLFKIVAQEQEEEDSYSSYSDNSSSFNSSPYFHSSFSGTEDEEGYEEEEEEDEEYEEKKKYQPSDISHPDHPDHALYLKMKSQPKPPRFNSARSDLVPDFKYPGYEKGQVNNFNFK